MSTCFSSFDFGALPQLLLTEMSPSSIRRKKYASPDYCSSVVIESKDHRKVEIKVTNFRGYLM